jgi:hypothetical protein
VSSTTREERLEGLLESARNVVIAQRETIRSQQGLIRRQDERIRGAVETLRYLADQYDSPLAREAVESLTNPEDEVTPIVTMVELMTRGQS